MDSEYLETIFIAVPRSINQGDRAEFRSEEKGFFAKYETLMPNVVPRSAKKLAQDDEFSLFGITLFRKDITEFNHRCRELKSPLFQTPGSSGVGGHPETLNTVIRS
jgi:V-type H+-transporting ATPase subunit C